MKSKRGQGLPLNTIVIAAIVLVVLVVLVMIFTGSMGGFVKGLKKDCINDLQGDWSDFQCTGYPNRIPITGTNCETDDTTNKIAPYCCIIQK